MSALQCLQSLSDFQHSMCFLSIQSPIRRLTTLYGRPSTGSGSVNGVSAPLLASSSALSLPRSPHASAPTPVELICVSPVHWGIPGKLMNLTVLYYVYSSYLWDLGRPAYRVKEDCHFLSRRFKAWWKGRNKKYRNNIQINVQETIFFSCIYSF